ncbi:hypothetical protein SUGI_0911540 [Cryptomeria japonica]|nr:hypothetical protein SUGI_0911540 [Cryptomeria japonica]
MLRRMTNEKDKGGLCGRAEPFAFPMLNYYRGSSPQAEEQARLPYKHIPCLFSLTCDNLWCWMSMLEMEKRLYHF